MSIQVSKSEPPSTYACHVDIQCFYADVTVPSDQQFQQWASTVIEFLHEGNCLDKNKTAQQQFEVSILVVDKTEIQLLNNQYRDKNSPTNVLSFPFDVPEIFHDQQISNILGDVIICAPIIQSESKMQNKSCEEHWAHMTVHGILHLLGYDHLNDEDATIMESLEVKILEKLNYKDPYMELTHE